MAASRLSAGSHGYVQQPRSLGPPGPLLGLLKLLRPTDPEPWTLRQVSRRVNSPKNDTPDLLEPVATA